MRLSFGSNARKVFEFASKADLIELRGRAQFQPLGLITCRSESAAMAPSRQSLLARPTAVGYVIAVG